MLIGNLTGPSHLAGERTKYSLWQSIMKDKIRNYLISLLEKKAALPANVDADKLNFIRQGYVDSIGVIKFVADIEAEFDIVLHDTDIESADFRTIGGLVSIIQDKIDSR